MIAVALVAVLLPLVRHGKRHRGVFALALAIAFALPLGAGGLYLMIGTPAALNGMTDNTAPANLPQAMAELRAHLVQQPDDLQGWTLLAQTSAMLHNPTDARDAYDHVLKLAPNDAEAMIGWAESDSMLRADHQVSPRAMELLKRAVQMHPDSQRGLWLLGIAQFQQGDYRNAASTWRLLQPQLEPGSSVAKAVAEQITVADSRATGAAQTAPPSPPATSASASIQVQVTLAPALQGKLVAGDSLFVYARAPSGPPMPLAVVKLDASKLPATVTLNDAMAMTPTQKLSSVSQVFVGARISHSGQPIAQTGDLEGNAGIVPVVVGVPIKIVIDKVH